MGENFASHTSEKGLITRIYRELKKLNSPKINDSMKKCANELNRTFSKDKVQMLQFTPTQNNNNNKK
jgi:hypothetical protein